MAEIKLKIKVRKDTTANLQAMTTVLENGEVAYSTNDHVLKVGDGTKAWNSLPNLFSSNADTLDNHDSDYFLNTSATAQTKSGNLTVNGLGLGHGNELWTNHGEKRIFINYRGANETVYDSSSTEQVVLDIGHGHGEDKLARFANDAITLYRNVVIPYNSSIGVNNKIFSNDAGELIISTDHDYNTFRTSNATYGIKGASGHIYDLASLDPTNCYWANVKVSATSSNETIPTFKSIIVSAPSSADVSAANIANLPSLKFVPEEAAQWGALVWSDYDAYQSPAALTLVGNQGSEYLIAPNIKATTNFYGHNIYLGYTNPTTFVSGQGIYWNPYVESTSDPSDAASITVIANGTAGGTELRIQQANDSTDIINLISPAFIYLNSKKAFSIYDSWLRINEDSGFSSGVYFGNSIIRSDRIIQGGTENFGLKIQSLQGGGTGWSEGIYVVETNAGSGYSTITAGSSDKNNLISLVNNTNGTQYLEVKTKHSGDSSATQRSFWWPSTGGIVATQEWISTVGGVHLLAPNINADTTTYGVSGWTGSMPDNSSYTRIWSESFINSGRGNNSGDIVFSLRNNAELCIGIDGQFYQRAGAEVLDSSSTVQSKAGLLIGHTNNGGSLTSSNDTGSFSIRGDGSNAAVISFHRPNICAVNFGLDTDNAIKIGGWSHGSDSITLYDSDGNMSTSHKVGFNGAGGSGNNYISAGTGDGGSTSTYNLRIASWYGIGFYDECDDVCNISFNLRNGYGYFSGGVNNSDMLDGRHSSYFCPYPVWEQRDTRINVYRSSGFTMSNFIMNSGNKSGDAYISRCRVGDLLICSINYAGAMFSDGWYVISLFDICGSADGTQSSYGGTRNVRIAGRSVTPYRTNMNGYACGLTIAVGRENGPIEQNYGSTIAGDASLLLIGCDENTSNGFSAIVTGAIV